MPSWWSNPLATGVWFWDSVTSSPTVVTTNTATTTTTWFIPTRQAMGTNSLIGQPIYRPFSNVQLTSYINQAYSRTVRGMGFHEDILPPRPPPIQRPARPHIQRQIELDNEAYQQRVAAAKTKATELLRRFLDPEQCKMFDETKQFDVIGRSGLRYRVTYGRSGNILVYDKEKCIERLCVHPYGDIPVEDVMAAQLLHLRDDDNAVRRIANRHPVLR